MKELVVISGKGGTGKTSVVAAFASLTSCKVLADCDVDAADLHLVLAPEIRSRHEFRSGHEAVIRQEACIGCGACLANCRFGAVKQTSGSDITWMFRATNTTCDDCDSCSRSCPSRAADMIKAMKEASGDSDRAAFAIDPISCEGCGVCVDTCPTKAISFPERVAGEWYVSDTRHGPMVHARLGIAAENSGKLVTIVRQQAKQIAEIQNKELILVDGPPGIGCPVIASVTGATQMLIVTEPTCSGAHDFERVVALTRHFKIPTAVCVNKWDINPEMTDAIETQARSLDVMVAGRIRYDRSVTAAQVQGQSVVDCDGSPAAEDIRELWTVLSRTEEK